ncbi:MAG: NAD(P)H-hydrate dehydratase [Candidatus Cloacimonetes bacterium]|jgi:NAD(P)H-hydrate epimerase|nr:NAD(P)H-hydrate dehydratase [Candidatus Cloacimonadota bacterium]
MQNILTASQMKELDLRAINELGLPARLLMENAGKDCARIIYEQYPERLNAITCVICGTGNNGGDGAVIARWLHNWGHDVAIAKIGREKSSPETTENFRLCEKLGIPILNINSESDLREKLLPILKLSSLVVDAIFGVGFHGQPKPLMAKIFNLVNERAEFIVSVDIASGKNADTGSEETAIKPDATLVIDSFKFGHFLGDGIQSCGDCHLIDIGIPSSYHDEISPAQLFDEEDFEAPKRKRKSHKGSYGKVYIFGGIPGYTGASVMAAHSALRAGCGYVYILHRIELMAVYALKLTEALSLAIPETPKTQMPTQKTLLHLLSDASAVLIGPGLGRDDYSLRLLEIALKNLEIPLVVDADGLNLISENPGLLQYIKRPNVLLTPHWGEFSRLCGVSTEDLREDCLGPLQDFVKKHRARVLLKSHFSIYHDGAQTLINTSGNDGLATGGSGDVLAGIITSFLAQGQDIPLAAMNASFLMGKTAELLAQKRATASILPTDIIQNLFVEPCSDLW